MEIIDLCGGYISLVHIRNALKCTPDNTIIRMHPAMEAEVENLGLTVSGITTNDGLTYETLPTEKSLVSLGRRPIISDAWFPEDKIRFELGYIPVLAIVNIKRD